MDKKAERRQASDLKSHIGYWLRFVSNYVSHSFAGKLADSGVTVAEWVIIREMYDKDEGTAPSVVAESTGLTRGAVSKLIDRLVIKGLVTREEARGDRRYQSIDLTEKGILLVPELAALADRNDEEFFAVLSQTERAELKKTLQKIVMSKKLSKVPVD